MGKQSTSDKDVAAQMREQFQEQQSAKPDVPSELITLPSKGFFYSEGHPLYDKGEIQLKYPTAREEDILTSKNLIQKGIVIDKFMESVIITPVDYNSLLLGDKNGIMIASRILAYGTDYTIEQSCPKCGQKDKVTVDLSNVQTKDVDFSKYTKGQQEFEVELKNIKGEIQHRVKFKLLNHGDIKAIDGELKAMKKSVSKAPNDLGSKYWGADREMTTRLKHAIVEVDGNRDKGQINSFVENLLSRHSLVLRTAIQEVTPDVEIDYDFECNSCGYNETLPIPIETSFFWPSGRL